MPYLFHYKNNFYMVDYTPRSGLCCSIPGTSGTSKMHQLHPNKSLGYSSSIDAEGKLHIITLADPSHIYHLTFDNGYSLRQQLVANASTHYIFSSPMLFNLYDELHMIYISHQSGLNDYHFVYQNLNSSQLDTLLNVDTEPLLVKGFTSNTALYVFYILKNISNELHCLTLTHQGALDVLLLEAGVPITDYTVCIANEQIALSYVLERYGKYELAYYHSNLEAPITLCTSTYPSKPAVFEYYDGIFINAMIDRKLQTFYTPTKNAFFMEPITSSIQNNLQRYFFKSYSIPSLSACEVYATTTMPFYISTLYAIDFDHIHPQSKLPAEFELLTRGLHYGSQTSEAAKLKAENNALRSQIESLTAATYNNIVSLHTVSSAKHKNTSAPKPISATSKTASHLDPASETEELYNDSSLASPSKIQKTKPMRSKSKAVKASKETQNTSSDSISSAKNAFMSELTSWDLPPKP